jgi:hypothetical protein
MTGEAPTVDAAVGACAQTVERSAKDIPFALVYLLDTDAGRLRLAGHAGLAPDTPARPAVVDLARSDADPGGRSPP